MKEEQEGQKYDEGKLDWTLVPWAAMEQVVEVLMHGERTHSRDNWRHVSDAERRYISAAQRHLVDYMKGERFDKESLSSVLAHAICDLLFVLELRTEAGDTPIHQRRIGGQTMFQVGGLERFYPYTPSDRRNRKDAYRRALAYLKGYRRTSVGKPNKRSN